MVNISVIRKEETAGDTLETPPPFTTTRVNFPLAISDDDAIQELAAVDSGHILERAERADGDSATIALP